LERGNRDPPKPAPVFVRATAPVRPLTSLGDLDALPSVVRQATPPKRIGIAVTVVSRADAHVAVLARLYVERPVTPFRAIYALRDLKIDTLADALKLRG
jgi:hypothetical protein